MPPAVTRARVPSGNIDSDAAWYVSRATLPPAVLRVPSRNSHVAARLPPPADPVPPPPQGPARARPRRARAMDRRGGCSRPRGRVGGVRLAAGGRPDFRPTARSSRTSCCGGRPRATAGFRPAAPSGSAASADDAGRGAALRVVRRRAVDEASGDEHDAPSTVELTRGAPRELRDEATLRKEKGGGRRARLGGALSAALRRLAAPSAFAATRAVAASMDALDRRIAGTARRARATRDETTAARRSALRERARAGRRRCRAPSSETVVYGQPSTFAATDADDASSLSSFAAADSDDGERNENVTLGYETSRRTPKAPPFPSPAIETARAFLKSEKRAGEAGTRSAESPPADALERFHGSAFFLTQRLDAATRPAGDSGSRPRETEEDEIDAVTYPAAAAAAVARARARREASKRRRAARTEKRRRARAAPPLSPPRWVGSRAVAASSPARAFRGVRGPRLGGGSKTRREIRRLRLAREPRRVVPRRRPGGEPPIWFFSPEKATQQLGFSKPAENNAERSASIVIGAASGTKTHPPRKRVRQKKTNPRTAGYPRTRDAFWIWRGIRARRRRTARVRRYRRRTFRRSGRQRRNRRAFCRFRPRTPTRARAGDSASSRLRAVRMRRAGDARGGDGRPPRRRAETRVPRRASDHRGARAGRHGGGGGRDGG